jgi:serine protease Do
LCLLPDVHGQDRAAALRARRITPAVEVFRTTKDAVVNISSTHTVQIRDPFDQLESMLRGFDMPSRAPTREYKAQSVGSGFVVHRSGYIVTNAHVVAQSVEQKAIFAGRQELDAEVVGVDAEHDLALLKVTATRPLTEIRLGRSDDLMVGETVIAIGNPLGLQHTCTSGIISALDRTLEVNEKVVLSGLIQTDASINPGNSGGPLLNVNGELVGINFAIRGDGQNIGFAIPVDRLTHLLPKLLDIERRHRILVGLELASGDDPVVVKTIPKLPADRAGLQLGDRIIAVNNAPVTKAFDFFVGLFDKKAGEQVDVIIERTGQRMSVPLKLEAKPRPDGLIMAREKLGVDLEELDPAVAQRLGLRKRSGLFIAKLEPNGPADTAKLRPGDLIMQVERSQVSSLEDLGMILEEVAPGTSIRVMALRFTNQSTYRMTTVVRLR